MFLTYNGMKLEIDYKKETWKEHGYMEKLNNILVNIEWLTGGIKNTWREVKIKVPTFQIYNIFVINRKLF